MIDTIVDWMEGVAAYLFVVWIICFALYSNVVEIYYMLVASIIIVFLARLIKRIKEKNKNENRA